MVNNTTIECKLTHFKQIAKNIQLIKLNLHNNHKKTISQQHIPHSAFRIKGVPLKRSSALKLSTPFVTLSVALSVVLSYTAK